MSFADQVARFFVQAGDLSIAGEDVPHTSEGNEVTPLVDGYNYFHELRAEVDNLKTSAASGKFFYFTNWYLPLINYAGGSSAAGSFPTAWTATLTPVTAFKLDDQQGGPYPDFIDELAAMAANGTDVRALPWISPLLVSYADVEAKAHTYWNNGANLLSVDAMRKKPGLDKSACLDTIGHALGSMHLKTVVCGDDTGGRAYVSGIDFSPDKVDKPGHPNGAIGGWHDVGAKIDGAAVQGVYDHIRAVWNEVNGRSEDTFRIGDTKVSTKVDGTPDIPVRTFTSPTPGKMHVQVLRTGPQMNFSTFGTDRLPVSCVKRFFSGFATKEWSFAPHGIFEFEAALKKAIAHAQRYIYVEDQGFWAQPIMDWLRTGLLANPELKLIMVHRSDPADGPGPLIYATTAINQHLCGGLPASMNPQVAFCERTDKTVIHAKTWIIDDQFVIIGSANCFRRSLYTDGEISVGVLDEDTTTDHIAIRYRRMLWGEHCGLLTTADTIPLTDIHDAIRIWNPAWTVGGDPLPAGAPVAAPKTPQYSLKKVPLEAGPGADQFPALPPPVDPITYDQVDADSRLEY
jgi:phosphatidylserine/phosphatidylglycerophosphate/cardiolipin synthase-like enzyme